MSKYWTDLVQRLTPYVPGEQRSGGSVVKLNTNENPYPPSPAVLSAVASIDGDALRRYPDPEANGLCAALANYQQIDIDQVFVGNGSDEVLALAFMAFFTGKHALQFPDISYSFYPVYCDLLDIEQQPLELNEDFSLELTGFINNSGGIIFPNPNAPTAIAVEKEAIEALLKRVPETVVIVDEAYAELGAQSVIPLIARYPNLLVTQTFSKSRSLAGMRVGAAFGDANLIEALQRVKNSFNSYPLDAVAQAAAIASLGDDEYYRSTIEKIIYTRTQMMSELRNRGYKVLESAANFIFVSPPQAQAKALFEYLNRQDILVRYWSKPRLADWLRISIGTDDELQQLMLAIDEFHSS